MRVSVVIATRNHSPLLVRTLQSIFAQNVAGMEVIVVDDGSTDDTQQAARRFPVVYRRMESDGNHYSPVRARNLGLRLARAEVIIQQSDDVVHAQPDAIERLITELHKGEFIIATVHDWDVEAGQIGQCYTGTDNPRPFFFLGAHWREDCYKIGGYDDRFSGVYGFDDDWFAACLHYGAGVRRRFVPVLGLHQSHSRPERSFDAGECLFVDLYTKASRGEIPWNAGGGPWDYQATVNVNLAISVLCCTFLRPKQLGEVVQCFLDQDYPGPHELLILDDAGQYRPQNGPDWQLVSFDRRFRSLGEKRMAAVAMADPACEALVMWDDDDLYCPHALSAVAAALTHGDFALPSKVLHESQPGIIKRYPGQGVFHPSWGFRRDLFTELGGYASQSIGEDDLLYHRVLASSARIVDPIALGYAPYFVWRQGLAGGYRASSGLLAYQQAVLQPAYTERQRHLLLQVGHGYDLQQAARRA